MTHLEDNLTWQALNLHQQEIGVLQMRDLFASEPRRFERFSVKFGEILFDYSKNRITEKTLSLLFELARQAKLPEMIESIFSGKSYIS